MTSSRSTRPDWRHAPARQQPIWPDPGIRDEALKSLSSLPALVFAGETRMLKRALAEAGNGNAFVLQCGDCSEDFSRCHGPSIHRLLKVILQMAAIVAFAGEKRVITIGRIAGQYAKPRSSETETVAGVVLPSYRGDMVNSAEPSLEARTADPRRMLEGYFRSAATLNLVRAFTRGGYAAMSQAQAWHEDFLCGTSTELKYQELVRQIRKSINFMIALGLDAQDPLLTQTVLYTSHEALLLEYEDAMTRVDTTTGDWYDTSAHMLWLGDRTRQLDGAHVEFLRGVGNPLGVKIGPQHDIDDVKRLVLRLNPANEAGRLALITRFGSQNLGRYLPELVRQMQQEGFNLVWICDPMHGNTYVNENGVKTRNFADIVQEMRGFFAVHTDGGSIGGGVHLELTGDAVTECLGGSQPLLDSDLHLNYQSTCDPRLNALQAIELAFEIADILQAQ